MLIAAALLHDPKLLIFDEPLSGLDVVSGRLFKDLLELLAAQGKAMLYISHVLEVVEQVCNRVIVIAKGRILADCAARRACESDEPAESGKRLCATGAAAGYATHLRSRLWR